MLHIAPLYKMPKRASASAKALQALKAGTQLPAALQCLYIMWLYFTNKPFLL